MSHGHLLARPFFLWKQQKVNRHKIYKKIKIYFFCEGMQRWKDSFSNTSLFPTLTLLLRKK